VSGDLVRPEPLDLLRRMEAEGKATLTSLDLGEIVEWETFAALCTWLGRLRDGTAWWIADALLHGDAVFGFEASQAEAFLRRSPETLRRWQWVAERVPPSRRRLELSFTHHEAVASRKLAPAEQVRWLDHAIEHGLSADELRAAVQCSLANESASAASGATDQGGPTPDPADPAGGREGGSCCPMCRRPWPQLALVEVAPKRKAEPGS
jgi:hypothetical protein